VSVTFSALKKRLYLPKVFSPKTPTTQKGRVLKRSVRYWLDV
jgi:hypothetical protein